jgi:hypothetical protein
MLEIVSNAFWQFEYQCCVGGSLILGRTPGSGSKKLN